MKILIQAVIDIDPETRGEALAGARGWIEGALAQPGEPEFAQGLEHSVARRAVLLGGWLQQRLVGERGEQFGDVGVSERVVR